MPPEEFENDIVQWNVRSQVSRWGDAGRNVDAG